MEEDEIVFESTGLRMCANRAIIGLQIRGDQGSHRTFGGYDDLLMKTNGLGDMVPFASAERKELAEFMADAWRKWGEEGGVA